MIEATINIEGPTLADIEDGIDEAKKGISKGYIEGFDGDDDRNYSFTVSKIDDWFSSKRKNINIINMRNNKSKIKVGKVFIYGGAEHIIEKYDTDSVITRRQNGHTTNWNRNLVETVLADPKYYE